MSGAIVGMEDFILFARAIFYINTFYIWKILSQNVIAGHLHSTEELDPVSVIENNSFPVVVVFCESV